MRISDKAIVLQNIKHGDKKHILKLFTKQHGTLIVAARSGSANSKVKPGALLPLNLVEIELTLRQNKEVHALSGISCYYVSAGSPGSISKLSIAQFMNEVLIKCLREQPANGHLYEFVETCIKFLHESESDFMNLHLYFLHELTKYLGFEPQNNFSPQRPFFDCREGRFSEISLSIPLGLHKEESLLFFEFIGSNKLKAALSNTQRQMILEAYLAYYKLHVPGFNDLKSLEVLREVLR
ncbi:MAG: recombination protein O N-terminal domain-containing protein [Bacteroidia bacterium]|nr:recombination protein O N-terminal domain-containing protein [Bacteroidia bacterium]